MTLAERAQIVVVVSCNFRLHQRFANNDVWHKSTTRETSTVELGVFVAWFFVMCSSSPVFSLTYFYRILHVDRLVAGVETVLILYTVKILGVQKLNKNKHGGNIVRKKIFL